MKDEDQRKSEFLVMSRSYIGFIYIFKNVIMIARTDRLKDQHAHVVNGKIVFQRREAKKL